MAKKNFHSGFVALIGKPNVGKSTLLNCIVGQKVAITSSRPQTTRRRILGVKHGKNMQIVFVDTPGFYKAEHRLGQWMLDSAKTEGSEADVVLWLADCTHDPREDDARVAEYLKELPAELPKILVINKIDAVSADEEIDRRETAFKAMGQFQEVYRVSAVTGEGVPELLHDLEKRMPVGVPYFPPDQNSDQTQRSLAEEIIREKVLRTTHAEVPHAVAVMVEECRPADPPHAHTMHYIKATIFVERNGQKAILLGKGGEKLRLVGKLAREELEQLFSKKIYLDLWVKVKEDWRERQDWLRTLGYE